jgi:SAM-dependent methyltransferase
MDAFMLNRAGIPYVAVTRDWMIHERMSYLTDWAARLPRSTLRVLDAGCGAGLSLIYLHRRCAPKISYYAGVDLDTRRARQRHQTTNIPHDFIDIDLDSCWLLGKFDLIFASEVIEHIFEDRRLFKTLFNHLADNGVLVVTTPNKPFVQLVAQVLPGFDAVRPTQDGGHVRMGYDPDELISLARPYPLIAISKSYLGGISMWELKKRNSMRNQGDFVNTLRFNPLWLLHRTLYRNSATAYDSGYWSLAMAFQNCSVAGLANGADERSA